ncbi:MAG: hypothetical protein HY343_12760 [Lentisphaerae bacterium]|nr:hypothetical protein [Lentisphaerota bacterium]
MIAPTGLTPNHVRQIYVTNGTHVLPRKAAGGGSTMRMAGLLPLLLAAFLAGCEQDPTMIPLSDDNDTASPSGATADTSSGAEDTSPVATDTGTGSISLRSSTAQPSGNLAFSYASAAYDSYNTATPHWRITSYYGHMTFTFSGRHAFVFHALGSTSYGVSYCYVNVYINGELYWENKFINSDWTYYSIQFYSFDAGSNSVKIELVGDTHVWIDEAYTR